ncbi:MAG: globin [Candidatus Nanopelagicales bacterium]
MVDSTLYEQFGGPEFFAALVADFYARVAEDDVLRPMYPEQDLGPAEDRLRMFLEQYWGGPKTYGEQRGHPRLRLRHQPFAVTPTARDRWLEHMRVALSNRELPPELDHEMWNYLFLAAGAMMNTDEPRSPRPL